VQRLLKTTDGGRVAIREFLVFDRELRGELAAISYDQWARFMQQRLEHAKSTLDDKAWALLREGQVAREEFIELAGMKAYRERCALSSESREPV